MGARVALARESPGDDPTQEHAMSLTTTPHLNFRGDARAALELYQSVFGGELTIATYGDYGMPKDLPGADGVVFGQVETAEGFRVMAYDIPGESGGSAAAAGSTRRENGTTITTQPFFVSVQGQTLDEVQAYWDRLSEGASVVEPLAASAWSPGFGMLTDGFGVTWSLGVAAARSAE
jgi:PhnB protein